SVHRLCRKQGCRDIPLVAEGVVVSWLLVVRLLGLFRLLVAGGGGCRFLGRTLIRLFDKRSAGGRRRRGFGGLVRSLLGRSISERIGIGVGGLGILFLAGRLGRIGLGGIRFRRTARIAKRISIGCGLGRVRLGGIRLRRSTGVTKWIGVGCGLCCGWFRGIRFGSVWFCRAAG